MLTSAPQAEKQKPSINGLMVETMLLKPSKHALIIPSIGTVEPSQKATLSSKVSGKLSILLPLLSLVVRLKKERSLRTLMRVIMKQPLSQIDAQLRSAKAS